MTSQEIARWRVGISSYNGEVLVSQVNPGPDSNAVLVDTQDTAFVLADDYDRLLADYERLLKNFTVAQEENNRLHSLRQLA